MLKEKLGKKIIGLAKEKGLSQIRLAEIIGVSQSYISRVKNGVEYLNLDRVEAICAALDYPVAKLFEDDVCLEEEPPPNHAEPGTPLERVMLVMFRELSSAHKGELLGKAEEFKIQELQELMEMAKKIA